MQIGTVSRLWLRKRSWRLKIHFWRNIVRFRKSYICSNKLDVPETNISFSQFNRIWNHLVGHWTEIGWFARSGTVGSNCFCSWKCFSCVSDRSENLRVDHKHHKSHNKIDVMKGIDAVLSNVQSARQEALLYVFENNEAVIKMIIKGRTYNETRFQNPQSCSWLVVRSN